MDRMLARVLLALSCLGSLACEPAPKLTAELEPSPPAPRAVSPRTPEVIQESVDPRFEPPVLGDPLGLLSKKPAARAGNRVNPAALDPGALRGEAPKSSAAGSLERDPRAVARSTIEPAERVASTTVRDLSVGELRNAVLARPAPHVLLFYASYCPACRAAMPSFVDAVRTYRGPAGFTAVSIDDDRNALAAYVPSLGGVIDPLWLARAGADLRKVSEQMGFVWPGASGLSIPRVAVFDARGHVVRQGGYSEVKRLSATLREL